MRINRIISLVLLIVANQSYALNSDDRAQMAQHLTPLIDAGLYTATEMNAILTRIVIDDSVIEAMTRPAEKSTWGKYRTLFVNDQMRSMGKDFKEQNWPTITQIANQYGLDPAVMLAITGVETRFGTYMGRNDVVDSLATLALRFPRRSEFFTKEFVELMYLVREENLDLFSLVGSYAGAMGMPQFMPSSYRNFSVDQDKDGKRDLFSSTEDIYGSVANYLADHGWREGEPIRLRVTLENNAQKELINNDRESHRPLADYVAAGIVSDGQSLPQQARLIELEGKDGPEYYLVFNNFDVILTYNRSPLYAMAVTDLADDLRGQ